MKRLLVGGLAAVLMAVSGAWFAAEHVTTGTAAEANCMIGGGGQADGTRFSAQGSSDGTVYEGSVSVTTPDGDRFVGDIVLLQCRRNGGGGPGSPDANVNIADIEGPGILNGVAGYEYGATMHDHGEGNLNDRLPDDFAITIVDGSGNVILTVAGILDAGNVQIVPPNPAHP